MPTPAVQPALAASRWRADQSDRHGEAGRAAQGRDPATRLNRVAGLARAVLPQPGDGRVDIGRNERHAPEEGGAVGAPPGALPRLGGLLDHLEDRLAEAEECLARRTRRRRLLADPAQVEACRLERPDRAVQVGGDRDDVVERRDAVGCGAGRGAGGALSEREVARPSRSASATSRNDQPTSPFPAPAPARRTRTSPSVQTSPSTSNPHSRQAAGVSAIVSSSRVGATPGL